MDTFENLLRITFSFTLLIDLQVKSYDIGPRTRTFFMAYPGRGVVYNVLASVGSNGPIKEPYVPIATYGCDFFSTVDGCGRLSKFSS